MQQAHKSLAALIVSTSYPTSPTDWRGRFIASMVQALAKSGELDIALWSPSGDLPAKVKSACIASDAVFLDALSKSGGIAYALRKRGPLAIFSVCRLLLSLRNLYKRSAQDVLHINWLQNALPLPAGKTPCLITVLGSDFGLLRLPGMTAMLRCTMRGRPVLLAPNAEWMCASLQARFGDMASIRAIPFGVDDIWFNINHQPMLQPPYHWLAVTRLTKGKLGTLFEWGSQFFGKDHILHLFGPKQDTDVNIPAWVQYHGPTNPQALSTEWFPKATGLITLSQHNEGRPQVILEAMAAGLPVIASRLPAHDDLILDGQTGMLVDTVDSFRHALEFLSVPANNQKIGLAARDWIIANVGTWDDCAQRYLNAYRDLLKVAA